MTDYSRRSFFHGHDAEQGKKALKRRGMMSELGTRIVHIMLFGAASIDVVITRVLYICTACIAATTPTTIQCFFCCWFVI